MRIFLLLFFLSACNAPAPEPARVPDTVSGVKTAKPYKHDHAKRSPTHWSARLEAARARHEENCKTGAH